MARPLPRSPRELTRLPTLLQRPARSALTALHCDAPALLLPTAAVAVLAIDSRWSEISRGRASLIDLVRPRELKKRELT